MAYLRITGGKKLHGSLVTHPSKNSAVAVMCAALMIKGKTTLVDVPHIDEVERMIELLRSIGVSVDWATDHTLVIDSAKKLSMKAIDRHSCEVTRASILLFGALAARERSFKVYNAGGCKLGNRTVRPHVYALSKYGISITSHEGYYAVRNAHPLKASTIVMYESGDTTTENAIMGAVLAQGTTIIKMASANYQVQDLCYFLKAAGAKIDGIGTTTLTITGVKSLSPVQHYPIMPDPVVAMTYIATAITTHSRLTIANCPLTFLELELCKLEVVGQQYALHNERKSKNGHFTIVDIEIIPSTLTALPDKIYGRPFPGLNIDNLVLFIPILTQASGRTLVHDWVFENRAIYSLELQKLGAKINLIDIHRVWVEGPTKFTANEVICPPALRPAVNVLICMLGAPGISILRNFEMIDRGYDDLYRTLNQVGASIEIVNE